MGLSIQPMQALIAIEVAMSDRNIRWGQLTGVSDDKGPYKLTEVETDGKRMNVIVVEPFGIQSVPHSNAQMLILVPDGDEGKAIGIAMPRPANRIDQQKEGEVTLQNHDEQQYVKLDANGNVNIVSPNANITVSAPNGSITFTCEGGTFTLGTNGVLTINANSNVLINSTGGIVDINS
jgi:phage gp45-like